MDLNSCTLLKVLLNAYFKNSANMMCRFLPNEDAEQVKALELTSMDYSYAFRTPAEYLEKIHYSWLAPILKGYPTLLRAVLAAALPAQQSACLRQLLTLEKIPAPMPPALIFLQNLLYKDMGLHNVTPEELLPRTPFRILVDWDKNRICSLVDLLSMHDLAEKLRHIVDRKRLRDIYACLSPEKLAYLRECMHIKEKVASPELNLDQWKGNPKELEYILHKRGLLRFGKALSGEDQAVLWHILHRLDTGRSEIIEKCLQSATPPLVAQALAEQAQNIIKYIDTKSSRE